MIRHDVARVIVTKSGRVKSMGLPRTTDRGYRGQLNERSINPLVLERAMELAGGDIRRLFVDAAGAVTVANRARRG